MGPKNFVKILDGNYDSGGTGAGRKKGGHMSIGEQHPAEITDEVKERSRRLKHILRHAGALARIEMGNPEMEKILKAASGHMDDLAESDMPKGLMEEKFYEIHDTMMLELYGGLSEEEQAALAADVPSGSVNWVRKELQARFKIPDPMEYDFDVADVPS